MQTKHTRQTNSWPTFVDTKLDNQQETGAEQALAPDLFTQQDGLCYAGTHLLLDCWEAQHLDDLERVEAALREAVAAAGATLLHIHLHHFTPNGGISGVAVLAESHISIHTWPERQFAALDIFMCGDTQPEKTIPVFKKAFATASIQISKQLRGIVPVATTHTPVNNSEDPACQDC